jgi:hypothetical protein
MTPEERFERIEALLHGMAQRGDQMEDRFVKMEARSIQTEARFIRDHERAMARMDKADARMEKADARMDKFDKQLLATRKLVEAGMKILVRLSAEVREVSRMQKDMLRFRGNGRNGPKH